MRHRQTRVNANICNVCPLVIAHLWSGSKRAESVSLLWSFKVTFSSLFSSSAYKLSILVNSHCCHSKVFNHNRQMFLYWEKPENLQYPVPPHHSTTNRHLATSWWHSGAFNKKTDIFLRTRWRREDSTKHDLSDSLLNFKIRNYLITSHLKMVVCHCWIHKICRVPPVNNRNPLLQVLLQVGKLYVDTLPQSLTETTSMVITKNV